MKKGIIITCLLGLIIIGGLTIKQKYYASTFLIDKLNNQNSIKNGDLIFQTSLSEQSKAIQIATKSKYSHCGIIYGKNGKFFVFEAVQPVKTTPLDEWIARGKNGHYVIKRIKNSDKILTAKTLF